MRNQKGVTLIALVVTIIVLIILAGVTIAVLTGDNGVIDRSKEAKQSQIEGEVRDRITLAVTSAKMYAEMKTVESTGYSASANLSEDTLQQIAGDLNGWTTSGTTKTAKNVKSGTGKTDFFVEVDGSDLKITYTTSDYANATNYKDAKIECWVKVTGNTFEYDSAKGTNGWTYTRKAA